jgi:serine protease AprX
MKTAYKQFPASSTAVDPVTGESFTSEYDIFTIGAGYLDVAAALANSDLIKGTAMSPIATYNSTNGQVYLTFDPSSSWTGGDVYSSNPGSAPSGIWDMRTVWGNSSIDADKTLWGAGSIWSQSGLEGFKTLWGASGLWADKTLWGASGPYADKTLWGADSSTSDSDNGTSSKSR